MHQSLIVFDMHSNSLACNLYLGAKLFYKYTRIMLIESMMTVNTQQVSRVEAETSALKEHGSVTEMKVHWKVKLPKEDVMEGWTRKYGGRLEG